MADQKITDLTNDASPTDDDLLVTVNSPASSPANRKLTFTNLKAFLKTYFDTLYQAAGSSSIPTMKISDDWSAYAGGRYPTAVTGGAGTISGLDPTDGGVYFRTGGSGGGYCTIKYNVGVNTSLNLFGAGAIFTNRIIFQSGTSGNGDAFFGIGVPTNAAAGHTFTDNHIGFKLVKVSGVTSVYGTVANGTTESVTSALTTITTGDTLEMICVVTTGNVAFYIRKNGGALSSVANLTTNIPSATTAKTLQWSISDKNDANQFWLYLHGWSYER